MSQEDVSQIRVGNSAVGIMGLKTVMEEMIGEYVDRPEQGVMEALLIRMEKRNYIPKTVRDAYGTAFLREFKKFSGKPVEEEKEQGLTIKVLGPGCAQCDRLEQELMQVMSETGLTGNVVHIRDIKEIGSYGVLGSPALLINGKVKAVGKVPPRNQLAQWLKEANDK